MNFNFGTDRQTYIMLACRTATFGIKCDGGGGASKNELTQATILTADMTKTENNQTGLNLQLNCRSAAGIQLAAEQWWN